MQFNIGDRVRRARAGSNCNMHIGDTGVVTGLIPSSGGIFVKADKDGIQNSHTAVNFDLVEHITNYPFTIKLMKTLSIMMQKLLDADTQTLVKAGFINGDLDLTTEGTKALNAIMFQTNKAALVTLAQEQIDSAKN